MNEGERELYAWPLLHVGDVLVAEDSPAVRGVLRRVLELHGCKVHEAENGLKALEIARARPVDLVITDLWMPVMNGVELIEALNSMEYPAEVIVLSAHIAAATTDKLQALGVFRTLRKPVEQAPLLEAVRKGLASDRRRRLREERAEGQEGKGPGELLSDLLVLVADDDDDVRRLLRRILSNAGYRVEEACNGEEAVEKVLALGVSVVLMDLNMPQMSGLEAVKALRQAARDCFVICLTGECTRRDIDAALRAGAISSFRKPFDPAEITAEVERLALTALHRKRFSEENRARRTNVTLAERARALVRSLKAAYGRRLKWVLVACVLAVLLSALAAPAVSFFVGRAARAARDATRRAGEALRSASRIESYLERDEARELIRDGR